ncbi:MAG: hypothetical protein VYE77_01690, partial [Planctomycetota bacterium]|nr:hypothetical protein [Planctomycetota bacterium]
MMKPGMMHVLWLALCASMLLSSSARGQERRLPDAGNGQGNPVVESQDERGQPVAPDAEGRKRGNKQRGKQKQKQQQRGKQQQQRGKNQRGKQKQKQQQRGKQQQQRGKN